MPHPGINGHGTISYNGFTFKGAGKTTEMNFAPKFDESGRVVVETVVMLSVRGYVTDDEYFHSSSGPTDSRMATIQRQLMQSGGPLVVEGLGYGDVELNTSRTNTDLNWGPRVLNCKVRPVGTNRVMQVDLTLQYSLARCGNDFVTGMIGDVKALNWSVAYAIDDAGLTTRTVSGYIEIVSRSRSASAGGAPYRVADEFRDKIQVPIPYGFTRMSQNWNSRADKGRMEFSIVDRELPSETGSPPGVSRMELQHRAVAKWPNFGKQIMMLNGRLQVIKGFPMGQAWERVVLLLRQRIAHWLRFGSVKPISIDIAEEIYSRIIVFSMAFQVMPREEVGSNSHFGDFVSRSGLLTAFRNAGHREHAASMAGTAWHNRGLAKLALDPSCDKLIDVCSTDDTLRLKDGLSRGTLTERLGPSLVIGCPTREFSYIHWENSFVMHSASGAIVHRKMKTKPQQVFSPGQNEGGFVQYDWEHPRLKGRNDLIVQKDGNFTIRFWMIGNAVRHGYPVEVPKVLKVWDREAEMIPDDAATADQIVGYGGGCPYYAKAWRIGYIVAFDTLAGMQQALRTGLADAVIATEDDPKGLKMGR
jgi:hypothetical protein